MIAIPAAEIAPGDRAPNFVLPGANGRYYMLYERVHGGDVLLVFGSDSQALQPFRAAASDFAAAGVEPFAVVPGDPPENAEATDGETGFFVVYDVKKAILAGYCKGTGRRPSGPGEVLCVLCDANLRVLSVASGPAQDVAHQALAFYGARTRPAANVLTATAPVLLVPDVLDRDMCRDLIEIWQTKGHEEGKVYSEVSGNEGDRLYHEKKKRLDHMIHDPQVLKSLQHTIGRRIAPELEKAFYFQGFAFDRMIIGCYDSARGDKFAAHRDNLGEMKRRTFALTVNLNSEDYEGGEVRFPEYGSDWYKAPSGCAVLFSCSLLHEVRPVARGRRFALLSFLLTPESTAMGKPGAQQAPNSVPRPAAAPVGPLSSYRRR